MERRNTRDQRAAARSLRVHENRVLEAVLDSIRRAIVVAKSDRTIDFATGLARTWIAEYFTAAPAAGRLPEALDLWVRQHDAAIRSTLELPRPRDPLVINRTNRRLLVRLLTTENETVLIFEEQHLLVDPASLATLGLTRREREVLAAMANGHAKAEIAQALGMSLRTVDTHVQHIHQRLGVSNRTAAAAAAFRASQLCGYPHPTKDDDAELRSELNRLIVNRN